MVLIVGYRSRVIPYCSSQSLLKLLSGTFTKISQGVRSFFGGMDVNGLLAELGYHSHHNPVYNTQLADTLINHHNALPTNAQKTNIYITIHDG